jgi:hypothetical protein
MRLMPTANITLRPSLVRPASTPLRGNHLEQNPPEISSRFRRASKLRGIKRAAPAKYKPTNLKSMEWSS